MVRGFQRQLFPVWAYALLLLGMLCGAMTAQAGLTPAGTPIKNLATVTYQDTLGNKFTAQSNESVVTVAEVYAPDLQNDQTKIGTRGQIVYFPHQLINKGNTTEVFSSLGAEFFDKEIKIKPEIYHDVNGNGQPDDGERIIDKLTVEAGAIANIVVAVPVPSSAENGDSFNVVVSAQSSQGIKLRNSDTLNIVSGRPVLVVTKEALEHKPAEAKIEDAQIASINPGSIQYRITVKNNGTAITEQMDSHIYDSFSDLLDVESVKSIAVDSPDPRLTIQKLFKDKVEFERLVNSGEKPSYDYTHILDAKINTLAPGATVSLTFTVGYKADPKNFKLNGEQLLKNRAYAAIKLENDKSPTIVASNEETTVLPQFYALELLGHDEDEGEKLKTSTVGEVSLGGTADFHAFVTNSGNGYDRYTLMADEAGSTFPKGTSFTYLDKTGSIELGKYSTDKGLKPVTASIAKGEKLEIIIRAHIPQDDKFLGLKNSKVALNAVSVGDNRVNDKIHLIIGSIKEVNSSVEGELAAWIEESSTAKWSGGASAINIPDLFGSGKVHSQIPVLEETYADASGQRYIKFGLYVANKSASKATSFELTTELARPDQSKDVGALWPVTFINKGVFNKADSKTNLDELNLDQKLSDTTPSLISGNYMKVVANVAVPVALADREAGLYKLVFRLSDKLSDKVKDTLEVHFTVTKTGAVTLTPNGSNQVEAGGSVYYEHELRNLSNKKITVTDLAGSGLPSDWSYLIFEFDKDGKNLVENGVTTLPPTELAAGDVKRFKVKVMSPANATPGSTQLLKLTGEYVLDEKTLTVEASDSTTVIKGQIRLYKQAAILKGMCKTSDNADVKWSDIKAQAIGTLAFEKDAGKVVPGEDCVVWQIIATNQGDAPAKQVTIRDAAPAFTTLVEGSGYVEPGKGKVSEDTTGGKILFGIGDKEKTKEGKEIDFTAEEGGTLQPGQSVEVRFTVKVN
ncbi:hypothetical protein [Endozoicomonas sp. Mp262]|uniref:hypothetical protein n=1 Tax=Endozoicomonas sp. Mp262 TaxID=2919499 RepID=UPI0021D96BC6